MDSATGFDRIFLIYNPKSTGNSTKKANWLAGELKKRKLDVPIELVPTEYPGHGEKLAYELCRKSISPLLVSVSGDGGYHDVVNGVLRAQFEHTRLRPICMVVPAGNANDHQRVTARRTAVPTIVAAEITKIDVLKVEVKQHVSTKRLVRYAHSYAGLGLTAAIAIELNSHSTGFFRELLRGLNIFFQARPFVVAIRGRRRRLDSLVFSNISGMAKMLRLSRGRPDDGVFEVSVVRHISKSKLLGLILRVIFFGFAKQKHVRRYQFEVVTPTSMQLDGEVLELAAGDMVTVSILPRVLRTLR